MTVFVIQKTSILYTAPNDDPVFGAHYPIDSDDSSTRYYFAEEPFGMIGCVEQIEVHNKRKGTTTS